ncbi:MAG: protein-glutamate O-methyltransferase CheR [Deltaproteobacteria bacterium]|nr:protein-glutamate O-methyltransferase CheR [Deltaproteobacteria bacterium]
MGVRDIVLERGGLDIGNYKDKCIKRRIAVRIRARGCSSHEEYLKLLKSDERETDKLLNVLTINVTQFFRNIEVYEKVREIVFPSIFREREADKDEGIRVWSPGCSSGEEPYSVAIMLREYFRRELGQYPLSIMATDFDRKMIKKGRDGIYHEKSMEEMPPQLKEKYFSPLESGLFLVDKKIRDMVAFKRKNILEENMYGDMDLVVCRNMLIYFSREQQNEVLLKLAKALKVGGYLVLGKAETLVSESRKIFDTVCTRERIYKKSNCTGL